MRTHLLLKGFRAAGAIQPRRIVSASAGAAITAQEDHDAIIGVSDNGAALGGVVSVVMVGITEVVAGHQILAGDHITSMAGGQATPATNNKTVVGIALEDGAIGDLVTISLSLSNH